MSNVQWLKDHSRDEVYALNNVVRWKLLTASTEAFENYIKLHAKYYFSPLNHIFLFLVNGLEALGNFDKVLVRDGVLSLRLFFLRNPTPKELQTKLLIHQKCKSVVPKSWEKNIYFYDYKCQQRLTKKNKDLIIQLHPDSQHVPNEMLINILNDVAGINQYEKISLLMTNKATLEPSHYACNEVITKTSILSRIFKGTIENRNLDQFTHHDYINSDLLNINPFNFLFSDCFLNWHFIFKGSNPISILNQSQHDQKIIFEQQVSPTHSIVVFNQEPITEGNFSLSEEAQIFSSDLVASKEPLINLCSEDYKKYVYKSFIKNAFDHH